MKLEAGSSVSYGRRAEVKNKENWNLDMVNFTLELPRACTSLLEPCVTNCGDINLCQYLWQSKKILRTHVIMKNDGFLVCGHNLCSLFFELLHSCYILNILVFL